MITKERLQKLINEGKPVYYYNEFGIQEYIFDNINTRIGYRIIDNVLCFGKTRLSDLKDLYENKEEIEFQLKYHTEKTLYFQPPTFIEFLKTRREGIYAHWDCGDISIVMEEDNQQKGILRSENIFRVDDENNYESFRYEYDEWIDNREEIYYKAVEYAKKLFLED